MPIADLLEALTDMQILGKLSLTVAVVLIVSWAFRFYSSRTAAAEKSRLHDRTSPNRSPQEVETTPNGTCRRCKGALRRPSASQHDPTREEDEPPQASRVPGGRDDPVHGGRDDPVPGGRDDPVHGGRDDPVPGGRDDPVPGGRDDPVPGGRDDPVPVDGSSPGPGEGRPAQTGASSGRMSPEDEAAALDSTPTEVCHSPGPEHTPCRVTETETDQTRDHVLDCTLQLPGDSSPASPAGRRSPCFLRRLEGCVGVGVGRELRQDLGLQGTYSSFLSKAEITVEEAHVVLEGSGDQSVVRGKIYEYYVESSSQSVSESSQVSGKHGRGSLDPRWEGVEVVSDSPTPLSPVTVGDLVSPPNGGNVQDPCSPAPPEPRRPDRPVLLRKESYLTAAEQSELHIPIPTPRASSQLSPKHASCSGEASPASSMSPGPASGDLHTWRGPSLETVAGAKFFTGNPSSHEVEGPAGKMDLGNCMEVLELAKKRGLVHLQQASLRVMSDNYFQVLREPRLYGRLMAGEREQIQRLRARGRRFLVAADMDPVDWGRTVGLQGTSPRASSGLHYYDDLKDCWLPLCPMPPEVVSKGCAVCTMDNYLFVALGCQGVQKDMKPSNRVFCFNPVTSIWKEVSPMNEARPHCQLAALRGHVYAVGGECLSSVERYDPRDDRWSFVAPLPGDTFAVAHRVAVCNGELFVSGGTLRDALLRYNPQSNLWRRSLVAGSRERTVEMVGVRSFLYRFDVSPLLGISVYRYHTVARLWYECCSKRMLRCPAFQCVAVDDTIFCLSRQFTMRFLAHEISPAFIADDLSVLAEARGVVVPFVLALPERKTLQTSV